MKREAPKYKTFSVWERYMRLSAGNKRVLAVLVGLLGFIGLNTYESILTMTAPKEGGIIVGSLLPMEEKSTEEQTVKEKGGNIETASDDKENGNKFV